VRNLSIINASQRDRAYLYAEAGPVQGNAVVVFKVDGTIYWSFHLWVTEYNPYETAGQKLYIPTGNNKGNIFMDRNLGALNNQYDAQGEARGLYYQFGRSIPFPRGADWTLLNPLLCYDGSGNPVAIYTGISVPSVPVSTEITLPPFQAIQASLQNPTTHYGDPLVEPMVTTDWPFSRENPHIWNTQGGNKTAFDPCPEGWRIPKQEGLGTGSPWYGLELSNFQENVPGYDFGRYHPSAGYYPFASYMPYAISLACLDAYYWSSYSSSIIEGVGMHISGESMPSPPLPTQGQGKPFPDRVEVNLMFEMHKAYAASVRCVVDANYLRNMPAGGLFGNKAQQMKEQIIP
jgi:hypothetical protein